MAQIPWNKGKIFTTPEQKLLNKQLYAKEYAVENKIHLKKYRKQYYSDPGKVEKQHIASRNCHLKRKYGITSDEYDKMFLLQNGCCAICKEPETIMNKKSGKLNSLMVDHSHKTVLVRQLLCHRCNTFLGMYEKMPALLNKIKQYNLIHNLEIELVDEHY